MQKKSDPLKDGGNEGFLAFKRKIREVQEALRADCDKSGIVGMFSSWGGGGEGLKT